MRDRFRSSYALTLVTSGIETHPFYISLTEPDAVDRPEFLTCLKESDRTGPTASPYVSTNPVAQDDMKEFLNNDTFYTYCITLQGENDLRLVLCTIQDTQEPKHCKHKNMYNFYRGRRRRKRRRVTTDTKIVSTRVLCAGILRVDGERSWYLDDQSGSFAPQPEHFKYACALLQHNFKHVTISPHSISNIDAAEDRGDDVKPQLKTLLESMTRRHPDFAFVRSRLCELIVLEVINAEGDKYKYPKKNKLKQKVLEKDTKLHEFYEDQEEWLDIDIVEVDIDVSEDARRDLSEILLVFFTPDRDVTAYENDRLHNMSIAVNDVNKTAHDIFRKILALKAKGQR